MKNSKLVSVMVACYNHAHFVEACLESVASNSYADIELIITDDGSSDASAAIIERWIEKHRTRFVRIDFVTQANSGVCKVMNGLVSRSSGEFLIPLAADDMLLSHAVATHVAALQAHPDWLALFADAMLIDEDGNVVAREYEKNVAKANKATLARDEFRSAELILRWCPPGPVFSARREAYTRDRGVGLYDESLLGEDRDFYLRLAARGVLGYIPDEVSCWRSVSGSLCRNPHQRANVQRYLLQSELRNIPRFKGLNKGFLAIQAFSSWSAMSASRHRNPLTIGLKLAATALARSVYEAHALRVRLKPPRT